MMPNPPDSLRFDDVDNAERLVLLHQDRLRFVHAWRKWVVWDTTRWRTDPGGVLALELAKDVPRQMYQQAAEQPPAMGKLTGKWAAQSSSRHKLQAMVDLARGIDGVLIDHNDLDDDPWALCVANGWIDLGSGKFHEPTPDKLMTLQAGAPWVEGAEAPLWEKCLTEWMPDPDLRDYFQRLCGASLVGQVRDHMLVIVYGSGGNGKGTCLGTLGHVLGDYFTVPHKSLLVVERHEPHDTVKASLFRTRMAVAAETDKKVRLNEASIKELTGGDLLRARRLYEDEWSFTPSHTLWLQTNYLPEVSGVDRGIWRRIKVLPWDATFTGAKEDRELGDKLREEASGILRWLVEGVRRWQEAGLGDDTVPNVVREATDEYRRSEDIAARWMQDVGLEFKTHYTSEAQSLIESWRRWTEAEYGRGRRFNDVAGWLEAHGCSKDSFRSQGKQRTIWQGIGWTTTDEPPPDDDEPGQGQLPDPM